MKIEIDNEYVSWLTITLSAIGLGAILAPFIFWLSNVLEIILPTI